MYQQTSICLQTRGKEKRGRGKSRVVKWERVKRKGRVNGNGEKWEVMNGRAKRKEMKEAKGE